ncbi:MAG TPA: bestrophin family ion channel [Pirellulaceae bacterium]|nr:bestrophin family ion channel [Pirellulaceae bacterium]
MIDYDPHRWWTHFFDIKGSMLREICARVTSCVLWSAVVVAYDHNVTDISISPLAHQVLGIAIGLLLVFRTNSSYDRFWEGRRLWGSFINTSRNMARAAAVYLRDAPELKQRVVKWTIVLAFATMQRLRGHNNLSDAEKYLTPEELQSLEGVNNLPLAAAQRITATLREARDTGVISDYVMLALDQNTQLLIDYLGGCERIQKTPLPFAYMVHLRRALIIYCFTLPLALVDSLEYAAVILGTLMVSYTFFGIEEIGVEIEGPFGSDANDLPLERFCQIIEHDDLEVAGDRSLVL